MNTKSRLIRKLSAALLAGLALTAGAAHAATATNGMNDAQGTKASVQQACRDVVKYIGREQSRVTVRECTRTRKVKSWAGPRNTIPVYEGK